MPAKRDLTMRQIRQTLRLASDGISARQTGRMLGVARSTIQDNLKRAQVAGLPMIQRPARSTVADRQRQSARGYEKGPCRGLSHIHHTSPVAWFYSATLAWFYSAVDTPDFLKKINTQWPADPRSQHAASSQARQLLAAARSLRRR